MKTIRAVLVVLVVLVIAGLVLWRFFPGLRQRGIDAYRQYGGWTEEARRADPVGFIEYAETRLAQDLTTLKQTRRRLAEARETIADETERYRELRAKAEELAQSFRAAYRGAAADGYPVEVAGAEYTRAELLEQVRLILVQRANYEQILSELRTADAAAAEKAQQLLTQISNSQASLAMLPAKREIARVNQLSGATEELMAQVNALLAENVTVLEESPVRTVEQLLDTSTAPRAGAAQAEPDVDVIAFLEARE